MYFLEKQVTSPQTSADTSETCSLPSTAEDDTSANTSLAESQSQTESIRMSPTPSDDCDFKLEGLTSTPNMVTSVQRTDIASPSQPVCEGSFVGRARHKDGSLLGIIFQVIIIVTLSQTQSSLPVNNKLTNSIMEI